MELASGFTCCGQSTLLLASKAHGSSPVGSTNNWLPMTEYPDLCPDGLGYLGLVVATVGADADSKLGMGFTDLGAQSDFNDYSLPKALHLWLYGWKRQGDDFKYDRRGPAKNARIFLWNDQYWDNIHLCACCRVSRFGLFMMSLCG